MITSTGTTNLQRIGGGREADVYAWGEGRVLRLLRPGMQPSRLDAELAGLAAAAAAGIRVPTTFGTETVDGRVGVIMERIHGPDLLSAMASKPWTVWKAGRLCGETQARINLSRAPASLPSARQAAARSLEILKPRDPDLFGWVESVLEGLPEGDRLCHGDFHPGQILLEGQAPVTIDWHNAKRGDSMYDYARARMLARVGRPEGPIPQPLKTFIALARNLFFRSYQRSYHRSAGLIDRGRAHRWEIVNLATRLLENIPGERDALEYLLRQEFERAR